MIKICRSSSLLLSIVVAVAISSVAVASDTNDHDHNHDHNSQGLPNCEGLLNGRTKSDGHQLVFSGRDEDLIKHLQEYADVLFTRGGLAEQLGLSVPDQIIQFLPGSEVNTIAANGRMPVGHWYDGAQIVASGRGGGVIYEMVIHGGRVRHSIYRDDVPLKHQYSILNHVTGHNHFGANTRYDQVRTADLNQSAYEFDYFLEKLKTEQDRQEVAEWYQYLLSLTWAQDVVGGDYETPDEFVLDIDEQHKPKPGLPTRTRLKHPKHPTANILQAFVANLPGTLPKWKIEMARRFEQIQRYIPGAVNTKIMNEGFATLMQELIPPHTKFNTFDHAMEYCCLIDGIIRPSMQNPYWLGLEAWRRIRSNFNARPEIKGLTPLERDRQFIEFATKNVISKMSDADFLRFGLDDTWLARHKLALTKMAVHDEQDPSLPPPNPRIKNPAQFVVVTRDYNRVREALIRQVKGLSYQFPRVVLRDLGSDGSGTIQLELTDTIGRMVPLSRATIAATLVVMSRLLHAPVSLESTFEFDPGLSPRVAVGTGSDPLGGKPTGALSPIVGPHPWNPRPNPYETVPPIPVRVRVVVYPDGRVKASWVNRDGNPSPDSIKVDIWQTADDRGVKVEYIDDPDLSEELKVYIDMFQQDLDLGKEKVEFLKKTSTANAVERAVSGAADAVPTGLLLHVPTTAHAVTEYWTEVNHRMFEALRQAVLGKRGIVRGANGVKVKALPDIPYFQFDRKALKRIFSDLPKPGVDKSHAQSRAEALLPGDLPLDVGPVDGEPGHKYWDEDPNGNGDGEGEGEPGEEPGDGTQAGEGGLDPTYVTINLDTYADALENVIELPNLRPLDGKTRKTDEARGGWAYRRNGPTQISVVARKAYARGLQYFKEKGVEVTDPSKLIRRGLSLMPQREWAVKHFEPQPDPEVNAVVTFMMDFSGSYSDYVARTKQMLYDIRALLKRKYKKVVFRYVAFDGVAYAFENPEEFFRAQLGGGTSYSKGLEKVLEVYQQFPVSKWDRYALIAGDYEDFDMGPGVEDLLNQVRQESQFLAGVRMAWNKAQPGGGAMIEKLMMKWHDDDPYTSFVDLAPENEYNPLVLRKIFKNKDPE